MVREHREIVVVQLTEELESAQAFDVDAHTEILLLARNFLARRGAELAVLHQDVPSLHHDLREALHAPALVQGVIDVHMVGLGRDRTLVLGIEDHDVRVDPRDRALPREETEHLGGRRRDDLDEPVQPDPPVQDPWNSIVKRSSTEGRPFGIFEKSSFPRSFWPSKLNGAWSVATIWRSSATRPFQSSSW